MGGCFAAGVGAVVALNTIRGNPNMGERRRYPRYGRVTNMAGLRSGNMTGALTQSGYTIVTTVARAYNLRMVDTDGRAPQAGVMARFADIG